MTWALLLPPGCERALGPLRGWPGVEVCQDARGLWLRGPDEEPLAEQLRRLPASARYRVDAQGLLRPPAARLPAARLPDGPWLPLSVALRLDTPPARGAGPAPPRTPLSLGRADEERPAALLLTSGEAWARWALRAPEVRLRPLSFALDDQGQALIRGDPLPPLPGRRLWEEEGLLLPCGLSWRPAVPAAVLVELFELLPGERALWTEDGVARLTASAFVPATRAAVRASLGIA